jgi:quercetin dioxygenase-like cupin family protein
MQAIEAYEDPQTLARFYFTHSDTAFTTGVTVLPPRTALPQHRRPDAVEVLVQVMGKSTVQYVTETGDVASEHLLKPGDTLSIPQGQLHIHVNVSDEPAATLFKAVGDTTAAVAGMRQTLTRIL